MSHGGEQTLVALMDIVGILNHRWQQLQSKRLTVLFSRCKEERVLCNKPISSLYEMCV